MSKKYKNKNQTRAITHQGSPQPVLLLADFERTTHVCLLGLITYAHVLTFAYILIH